MKYTSKIIDKHTHAQTLSTFEKENEKENKKKTKIKNRIFNSIYYYVVDKIHN
jgi:hypothetical protein